MFRIKKNNNIHINKKKRKVKFFSGLFLSRKKK